jgi:hypothetical protein
VHTDSPRSEAGDQPSPTSAPPSTDRRRPTTAPGYGHRRGRQLSPTPRPSPRHAWGDASSSLHITNGLHIKGENRLLQNGGPVMEEIRVWAPKLAMKGEGNLYLKYHFVYFILFYFILFYFILFYFILFHFILFYFILFYFILFIFFW